MSTGFNSEMENRATECPDWPLLCRIENGDLAAFEQLYYRYRTSIAARIYSIVGNVHDTEELVQETFVTAHRELKSFANRGSFEGWLRRIAMNCALMALRKRRKIEVLAPVELADRQDKEASRVTCPHWPEQVIHSELEAAVHQAVAELPEDLRRSFCLAVLDRQSYDEVGAQLGISVATVKIRVYRARERLKTVLRKHVAVGGKGAG